MLFHNEFYLTLIRHGQSTTNANPDLMGQEADTPLSEDGITQANKLARRLEKEYGITHIYSSSYTRALDTAKIATENISMYNKNIVIADELREYDAGDWTHSSRQETITMPIIARMGAMGHSFLPPNGESLHQVERRASKWLEDKILYSQIMIDYSNDLKSKGYTPPHILCFSHGMTIKCLLHYIMGFSQNFTWKVTIDNTSLTRLYFGTEGWRLLCINDKSHLER